MHHSAARSEVVSDLSVRVCGIVDIQNGSEDLQLLLRIFKEQWSLSPLLCLFKFYIVSYIVTRLDE